MFFLISPPFPPLLPLNCRGSSSGGCQIVTACTQYSANEMPPRSRKREREASKGKDEESRQENKAAEKTSTEKAGQEGAGAGAAGTNGAAPDYSQQQVWDKRYRDGIFVEWYCGFDHVRPLFERFIPKVPAIFRVRGNFSALQNNVGLLCMIGEFGFRRSYLVVAVTRSRASRVDMFFCISSWKLHWATPPCHY